WRIRAPWTLFLPLAANGRRGDSMVDDFEEQDLNEELLPAKELQKRQRKLQYEKAKAAAKADRMAQKKAAADKRAAAQAAKDQALWASLKRPGSDGEL